MKRFVNVWVIGGDNRYTWAAKQLREDGLPVKCWGVPEMENQAERLEDALQGADLVLLPMWPFQQEMLEVGGETIPAALLPRILAEHATLVAGQFPVETEAWLQQQGVRCVSYLEQEPYLLRNASITAEGAIYLLLHHMKRTVQRANILVVGYGRIGRFLVKKLKALGANVTVAARKSTQRTELSLLGVETVQTGVYENGLECYDAVVNTVPSLVIHDAQAKQITPGCVCIEVASAPGGFPEQMRRTGHVVMGNGLPGKTAPQTAGAGLAKAVWEGIEGEERTLE